jgi:hypothetical protein
MPCESFRTIGGYDVLRSRTLKGRPLLCISSYGETCRSIGGARISQYSRHGVQVIAVANLYGSHVQAQIVM